MTACLFVVHPPKSNKMSNKAKVGAAGTADDLIPFVHDDIYTYQFLQRPLQMLRLCRYRATQVSKKGSILFCVMNDTGHM